VLRATRAGDIPYPIVPVGSLNSFKRLSLLLEIMAVQVNEGLQWLPAVCGIVTSQAHIPGPRLFRLLLGAMRFCVAQSIIQSMI
jgi:hypothetical protein